MIEGRKLNVGCGFDKRAGYVNIDFQAFHDPDIVADALDLHMVPSNWAEELIVSDIIEHFKRTQTSQALLEWNRILRIGGVMKLRTTYLTGLMRRLNYDWFGSLKTHKELIINLFSSQNYLGDFHCTAFTEKLMRYYLWAAGFEIDSMKIKDNWLFDISARKIKDYSYQDILDSDLSDSLFIAEIYARILDRKPDPEGLAGKLALLKNETSRSEILKGVLRSDEREDLMMQRAPEFALEFDPA